MILSLVILRQACVKGWPVTGIWRLGIPGRSLPFPHRSGSLCPNHLCRQCGSCQTPAFLLGVSGLGSCWTEVLCDQSPVKTQSIESLTSWMTFPLCVHSSWQEELTASHVTPLGKDFYLVSYDSATCTFSLCWFYFC